MPDHPVPHHDIAGYVLGALDPVEAEQFSAHVRTCDECRREVSELASLRVVLDRAMPATVLPPHLEERTFAAIERAVRADAEAPVEAPLPRAPRSPRNRRLPAAAASAALAGVAALVAGLVLMSDPSTPVREITLVAAEGVHAEAVARLHREEPGVIIELSVTGLAVPPEGSFYECWYVGDDDSPERPARLTAGTFLVAGKGTTEVRMTTAADREHFPRIEVTLEPGDGDPRSTGPVVLRSVPRS